MANNNRAPKQWQLSPNETLNTFKNWKENLVYSLSLDTSFKPYLKDNVTWGKQNSTSPHRGFTDDAATTANAKTKEEKTATLNLMLGQIANYATVISRNQIIKNSVSLNDIWNKIREHYGFHTTGSRFLDLTSIRLNAGERPEDLYQRLVSFIDDNLLTKDCALTHHSSAIDRDEEISPTLENVTVLLWLERIHVNLPSLIKQRYGAELRNKTLASIKPEISQALSSLLEELSSGEDSRILRAQTFSNRRNNGNQYQSSNSYSRPNSNKYCCLCRAANRPGHNTHYLSQCRFLPEEDRRRMSSAGGSRIRAIETTDNNSFDDDEFVDSMNIRDDLQHDNNGRIVTYGSSMNYNPLYESNSSSLASSQNTPLQQHQQEAVIHRRIPSLPSIHRRVTTCKSPVMQCFYRHIPISLCLDTGAESNLISEQIAKIMNLQYSKTDQGALQADEKTPLAVIGEVSGIKINKGAYVFTLDALIIKDSIGYIVAGEPFLEENDIAVRPAKRIIIIQGRETIPYGSL